MTFYIHKVDSPLYDDLFKLGYEIAGWREGSSWVDPVYGTLDKNVTTVKPSKFVNMSTKEVLEWDNKKIYRLVIHDDGHIGVDCYGIDSIDNELELYYPSSDKLPMWVQERLALLSMLDPSKGNDVPSVGRRISNSIYWVYAE